MQVYGNKIEIHSHICNSILCYAALTTYLLKIICGKSFGCSFQPILLCICLHLLIMQCGFIQVSSLKKHLPYLLFFSSCVSFCFFFFFNFIYVEFVVLHFVFVRVLLRNNGSLNLKRVKTRQSCYSPGMFCKPTKRR